MNVMLTGANGFLGRSFLGEDYIKRVVVRNDNGCQDWHCDKFFVDTIDGHTNWYGAFDDIDVVIHLAAIAHKKAINKHAYQSVNVEGTIRLARAAADSGVKRFIFISSIGVHGSKSTHEPISIDSPIKPANEYTMSKLDAEKQLKQLTIDTGLDVVVLRPTLVYGPGAPGNFGLLIKLVSCLPMLPFGLVDNKRSFISVRNLKDLLKCCCTHPNASNRTLLASEGTAVSIKQLTNVIATSLGKKTYQLPIPVSCIRFLGQLFGRAALVEQLVGNFEVDSARLKELLDWTPPYSMEESMADRRYKKKDTQ